MIKYHSIFKRQLKPKTGMSMFYEWFYAKPKFSSDLIAHEDTQ